MPRNLTTLRPYRGVNVFVLSCLGYASPYFLTYRQAEALGAYAEARKTLVDDLGIEPSEALQRLQRAILRHEPSLETPAGTAAVNGIAATETAPPPTPSPRSTAGSESG